jgi:hypothetical protein
VSKRKVTNFERFIDSPSGQFNSLVSDSEHRAEAIMSLTPLKTICPAPRIDAVRRVTGTTTEYGPRVWNCDD